jgi:hypothetical protein
MAPKAKKQVAQRQQQQQQQQQQQKHGYEFGGPYVANPSSPKLRDRKTLTTLSTGSVRRPSVSVYQCFSTPSPSVAMTFRGALPHPSSTQSLSISKP